MSIDWTKPLETCEKPPRKVKQVLTTTRDNKEYPVVVDLEGGHILSYTTDGVYHIKDTYPELNLRNIPEKKESQEIWVGIGNAWDELEFKDIDAAIEDDKENEVYIRITVRFIRAEE